MREWLRRWLSRRAAGVPARLDSLPPVPITPRARPSMPSAFGHALGDDGTLPHPHHDPHRLFPFLRAMRDAIPDVSAGVWAWVRLCSTPRRLELIGGGEAEQERARELIRRLDARVCEFDHARHQGFDALTQSFFLSVFTYGAFAGEVTLTPDRRAVDRFYLIDPASVRFRRAPRSRRIAPFQLTADGATVRLSPASFFYHGLDPDGDSPYGRSPLVSLPFVARIQQQLLEDIGKAMHNAGYPQLHIRYTPPEREPGEALGVYQDRIRRDYETIRDGLRARKADSNYLTYDNIEISYIGPGGQSVRWQESYQAVCEQVISGLHLAPFMLGRNWGTTESWGRSQYRLITNNAASVQTGARRLCEWLANLELALAGLPVRAAYHFAPHDALDRLEQAQADEAHTNALVALYDRGLLDKPATLARLQLLNTCGR